MSPVAGWENFYVIVGSSAGALIGLQFVVMTLLATRPIGPGRSEGADAFATPTIVHFATVLLVSAIACAPWHSLLGVAISYRAVGLLGMLYESVIVRRMRTQNVYKPVFEDWVFHALLPFAAYATLTVSAWFFVLSVPNAMFGLAAAALVLLLGGMARAGVVATRTCAPSARPTTTAP